ncbi:GSCOCG00009826001-RA-CDS, partial [Cotesia congregata]
RKELEQYLSQPRALSIEDILIWWKRHELQYPILAKMARDFLSISATSVPAERLFSKASLVIRKHRNRLNNESARWLLCINSWSSNRK